MSLLVRKEIRLLLPAWIAALVAATMPLWPGQEVVKNIVPVLFGAALLALSLSTFGGEASHGTFGLLLVQPVERRRFWRVKTGLLALALASVWVLFAWAARDNLRDIMAAALMTVLAFSGGLWTTLLLRDFLSALFCAFLVPAILCVTVIITVRQWIAPGHDEWTDPIICLVLGAYAIAGFFWARRLFFSAQDISWAGGQVSLPSAKWFSLRQKAGGAAGRPS